MLLVHCSFTSCLCCERHENRTMCEGGRTWGLDKDVLVSFCLLVFTAVINLLSFVVIVVVVVVVAAVADFIVVVLNL